MEDAPLGIAMEKALGVRKASRSKAASAMPAIEVLIANETDVAVDVDRLEQAVVGALAGSSFSCGSISVAIVDDATIHRLNRQFLDHDYPTDVLSFVLEDEPPRLEGEIIVSTDTAARCAAELHWPAADELLLYVIHGALHLCGYGDKESAAEAAMRAREASLLDALGVQRSPTDSRWSDVCNESGPQEKAAP